MGWLYLTSVEYCYETCYGWRVKRELKSFAGPFDPEGDRSNFQTVACEQYATSRIQPYPGGWNQIRTCAWCCWKVCKITSTSNPFIENVSSTPAKYPLPKLILKVNDQSAFFSPNICAIRDVFSTHANKPRILRHAYSVLVVAHSWASQRTAFSIGRCHGYLKQTIDEWGQVVCWKRTYSRQVTNNNSISLGILLRSSSLSALFVVHPRHIGSSIASKKRH